MMKAEIKINNTLQRKLKRLEQTVDDRVQDKLVAIAHTAVNLSPVDTGAYVSSFSFSTGRGRPRGKSSKNLAKGQYSREEGLANLMQDIQRIPSFKNTTRIVLRNNAPHARAVEYKHGYAVFTKIRNIHG